MDVVTTYLMLKKINNFVQPDMLYIAVRNARK
jgi:hypothetical protein